MNKKKPGLSSWFSLYTLLIFKAKILPEKFFDDAYFTEAFSHSRNRKLGKVIFKMKKFGKKFFDDAYFREVISVRDFCLFLWGVTFSNRFFGEKNS